MKQLSGGGGGATRGVSLDFQGWLVQELLKVSGEDADPFSFLPGPGLKALNQLVLPSPHFFVSSSALWAHGCRLPSGDIPGFSIRRPGYNL